MQAVVVFLTVAILPGSSAVSGSSFRADVQQRHLSEGLGLLDDLVFKTGLPFSQEP